MDEAIKQQVDFLNREIDRWKGNAEFYQSERDKLRQHPMGTDAMMLSAQEFEWWQKIELAIIGAYDEHKTYADPYQALLEIIRERDELKEIVTRT